MRYNYYIMKAKSNTKRLSPAYIFMSVVLMTIVLVNITVSITRADAGYALAFDGINDTVKLGHAAEMMASTWTTTKTIEVWVKPEGPSPICIYGSAESCDYIFGDKPEWWGISRGIINGQDRIWVFNWDGTPDRVGATYTPGEWVHITLVHGGGILKSTATALKLPARSVVQPASPAPAPIRICIWAASS